MVKVSGGISRPKSNSTNGNENKRTDEQPSSSQTREEKIRILKGVFPTLDADNYADDIANIEHNDDVARVHFHSGSQVKVDRKKSIIKAIGDFTVRSGEFLRSLAENEAYAVDESAAKGWELVRKPGGVKKLSPLSRSECELLVAAWKARQYQNVSPSPQGAWIEINDKTHILDRGDEVFLFGPIDDDGIGALLQKAADDWDGRIELTGSDDFKLRAWAMATVAGIEVIGYEPPAEVRDEVLNSIKKNIEAVSEETTIQVDDDVNGAKKPSDEKNASQNSQTGKSQLLKSLPVDNDDYDVEEFTEPAI